MKMHQNLWLKVFASFPFAQPLLIGWQIADRSRDAFWPEYEAALNLYLTSMDVERSLSERYNSLLGSRDAFNNLITQGDGHIATWFLRVRCLFDLGERKQGVDAVRELISEMAWIAEPLDESLCINVNRPFLPPVAEFDARHPRQGLGKWIQASVIEALEKKRDYSSYFNGDCGLLQKLILNPNHDLETERRLMLQRLKSGHPIVASEADLTDPCTTNNHNISVWKMIL